MTKSSTFVRSWLGFSNSFYTNFNDCFISIEPEKLIHIIINKSKDNNHEEVFNKLIENRYFLYKKDLDFLCVFTFKVPDNKEQDFDNFVLGKYSQFSNSAKELIIMSHEKMDNIKNLAVILYPEKRHRDALGKALNADLKIDAEIYSKPDMTKELLPEVYK